MKIFVWLAMLIATFSFGYGSGASHRFPDLDTLFGVSRVPPMSQVAAATPTPAPGAWMASRKSTLDEPAHNQTGGVVGGGGFNGSGSGGWANSHYVH